MERLVVLIAFLAYLGPTVASWWPRAAAVGRRELLYVAGGAHLLGMGIMVAQGGSSALGSIEGVLFLLAAFVALGWPLLLRWPRLEAVQRLLLTQVVVLLGVGLISPGNVGQSPPGAWLVVHVLLVMSGYAGFAMSFALSTAFLVVRRRLKSRDVASIGQLPPLDTLDQLNFRAMVFGFVTLTAGSAMGLLWGHTQEPVEGPLDFTVVATGLVWLWYAVGLYTRLIGGWRGRLAAVFGVVGFAGLAMLLVVLGFVMGGFHGMWV